MPSPFPGMDPYLEDPVLWPGVHQGIVAYLRAALNSLLPSRYVADIGERVYLTYIGGEKSAYPDVTVFQVPSDQVEVSVHRAADEVATAYATEQAPWVLQFEDVVERREPFVQILAPREGDRVVTVIEVLSPANKTLHSEGRYQYLHRQHMLLHSPTHLLEVDLLHTGAHTVAAPLERLKHRGMWDYLFCLHRAGHGGLRFEVWPARLRQRLPHVHVPLLEGDPDVELEIQAVFDRCYRLSSKNYHDREDFVARYLYRLWLRNEFRVTTKAVTPAAWIIVATRPLR